MPATQKNKTTADTRAQVERLQGMIAALEAGDEAAYQEGVDALTQIREQDLYRDLGKLTRDLHDAMKAFQDDSRLSQLAHQEMPDARDRLSYVVDMTEKAAHRTMDLVEETLPMSEEFEQRAADMFNAWQRFRSRQMEPQEFRDLTREISAFLQLIQDGAGRIRHNLSELMLAQDYQDISGQIIRRVTGLVQELEAALVNLVRLSGTRLNISDSEPRLESATELAGPRVPGRDETDVMADQDDVDELLSSLGF